MFASIFSHKLKEHVFLPSSNEIDPEKTRAANSPILNPAVEMQFSIA